ncbi:unnamed protein product [Peniophora sp. CBMAI 1063]|nr:unnamed protein product [Peniophora sp. CBMAI 1063]
MLPSLWPDIHRNVSDVIVHVLPADTVSLVLSSTLAAFYRNLRLDAEVRAKMVTHATTSKISVRTPTQHTLNFEINLNYAHARDLKLLLQQRIDVPVEQQILRYKHPRRFEVHEGDPLMQCDVRANSTLILDLKPRKAKAYSGVVSRARR